MSQAKLWNSALTVAAALRELRVPFLIGGSVASQFHGEPRLTNDVDIAAVLRSRDVRPLARALEGAFYADEVLMRHAIDRRASFNLIHIDSASKIDVHVLEPSAFEARQLERAVPAELAPGIGVLVPLASAEDTVLQKLLWNRKSEGASLHQLRDVLGVLKHQGARLDLDYMRTWAHALGLESDLELALERAGIRGK